jgi:hypothetical protein
MSTKKRKRSVRNIERNTNEEKDECFTNEEKEECFRQMDRKGSYKSIDSYTDREKGSVSRMKRKK